MNRPVLLAALLFSLTAWTAHATEIAAPATPPKATAAAASASAAARTPVRAALPVGAETLPAEWLDAVEPGLSRLAHAPSPAAPKRAAAAPGAR